MPDAGSDTRGRELLFEREFDAPRELVWNCWTEVKHLVNWWGPDGFRTTYQEFDLRPGGSARFVMHGPDGHDWPNKMWFKEVDPPRRLVFDHGDFDRPWFHVTVDFLELGAGRTRTVQRMLFDTVEACENVKKYGVEGNRQTNARLKAYLESLR